MIGDVLILGDYASDGNYRVIGAKVKGEDAAAWVELASGEADRAARWMLIYKDLEFSEAKLAHLLSGRFTGELHLDASDTESLIVKGLIDSALLSYAKAFVGADKGGKSSSIGKQRQVWLDPNRVFVGDGALLRSFHEEVMRVRHSFLAHAGASEYETAKPLVVLDPNPPAGKIARWVVLHTAFKLPDESFLQNALALVRYVKSWHYNYLNKLLDSLEPKAYQEADEKLALRNDAAGIPQIARSPADGHH